MKRLLVLVCLISLSACTKSAGPDITLSRPPIFMKGAASPLEIQILDGSAPAAGYSVEAEFSMARMDHGTASAVLQETEPGRYSGEIALPMGGEWNIAVNATRDGKTVQKDLTVQLNDGG